MFEESVLEFYHNPTDTKQAFHHIVNQLLVISIFDNVHTHLLILSFCGLKTRKAVCEFDKIHVE